MTICAKFDGRPLSSCTRGGGCICMKEQQKLITLEKGKSMFTMFYAEKLGESGPERGVFLSIAEFVPYRALGWEATSEINLLADAYLFELGAQELNNAR